MPTTSRSIKRKGKIRWQYSVSVYEVKKAERYVSCWCSEADLQYRYYTRIYSSPKLNKVG